MSTTAVRLDLWPAEVITDPDAPDPSDRRRVYPVRVVVTLDEILVFKDGSPPSLIFRDGLVSFSAATPSHRLTKAQRRDPDIATAAKFNIATTDTGHALSFTRASGCGCGSKLKVLSLQRILEIANNGASTPTTVASNRDAL